ncbi:hypothetical protein KQX54_013941 [Cotesia glomerata]|uniref:OTU domain-containing protein n=1 Tax=Cotesia glomerata TaxID=32391 RepID=A0AAV7HRB3_COTGL|nr:hypothetical protein KQX54_013941 [Cotesia glomerata]
MITDITIGPFHIEAMLDSGSERSYISETAYNRIQGNELQELSPDPTNTVGVTLADSASTYTRGGAPFKVELDGKTILTWLSVLPRLSTPVILEIFPLRQQTGKEVIKHLRGVLTHWDPVKAYYQRQKNLKKNEEKKIVPKTNAEHQREFRQRKAEKFDVDIKRRKLCSNEENVVQGRAVENIENVTLQENQFHSQQLYIYEQRNECITPEIILHRNTGIPGDGNCLFHSLINVLQLQIETCDLRNQLRDSPYLSSCHNPQEAYNILSSTNEFGDLDCLYLFSKMYNQNVCVHYCFYNMTTTNDDTIFCHFKANDTQNWIHLHLCEQHFTPFYEVSDLLETIQDATQNEAHIDANIQLLRDNYDEDPTEDNHNNYENEIEIDREDRIGENIMDFIVEGTIPVHTYYRKHSKSHIDFDKEFTSNSFGHSCIICDRLWWKRDLKMSTSKHESILKTILFLPAMNVLRN